ncbi:MAG: hypothetical protein L3J38_04515 [Thiomicrorhabdus sp.]|nr:hypothetical protein [Thiomicrorhabdus sp.]
MLDIEKSLLEKKPNLSHKTGTKAIVNFLKMITHETEINAFIATHQHLQGFAFLNQVLNHFHFSYNINAQALNRIPFEGRLLIVANDLLNHIEPLKSLFLSVDNLNKKNRS